MEKYSTCSLSTAAQAWEPQWPAPKTARGGWERDQHGNVYPTLEGAAQTWASPSTQQFEMADMERMLERQAECKAKGTNGNGFGLVLSNQVQIWAKDWAAPQARDHFPAHPDAYIAAKKADGHGMRNLNDEASKWAAPTAQNHKGSSEGSIMRSDGKSREDILSYQAEQFFRPPSSLDQPIAGGSMSSTDSPNSNQPSVKRKLNPIFVEALMRWPTGLSGFERQEMASILWWLRMPSFLSQLCSQPEGERQMDLFGEAA